MDFKKAVPVTAAMAGGASAQLNGTELSDVVTEAFIVISTLLTEIVGIVPELITLGIYMAILGAVVGLFALVVYAVREGIKKGVK